MRAPRELLPLLGQLGDVLGGLIQAEAEKVELLTSSQHALLDEVLSREQALLLSLRGLERQRSDLLARAHLENKTFRELLAQEDDEGRRLLSPAFSSLEALTEQLRQTKENSDRLVRVRLHEIETLVSDAPHYDRYG